jgi:hypothetical protein
VVFLSSCRQMLGYCLKNRPRPPPSTYFPIRQLLTTLSFDAILSESLKKRC